MREGDQSKYNSNLIRMGQQSSLNCGTSTKQHKHEIQTTGQNALQFAKNSKDQSRGKQTADPNRHIRKTSLKGESQTRSLSSSNIKESKTPDYLPEHQNLTTASYQPFENSHPHALQPALFLQNANKTLAEIISPRHNTAMHFPMSQVITLVESLVYSLGYMSHHGFSHHDYYPTNISYHAGIFKVKNPKEVECSGYQLTKQRRRFSFLSPQLIEEVVNDSDQSQISEEVLDKGDIFAIGMILLEFCTLQPSSECYDEENYSIVDSIVKQRLQKIKQIYSFGVAECIQKMLTYEIGDRKNARQISYMVFLNNQKEKQIAFERQSQIQQQNRLTVSAQLPPKPLMNPPAQMHANTSNIAVPTPNYVYSRIGPNNQGLLSPSTLTNKLKVIERIHEKPSQEDESQGTPSRVAPFKRSFEDIQQTQPQMQSQYARTNYPPPSNVPPKPDQNGYQIEKDKFMNNIETSQMRSADHKYSFATSNDVRPQSPQFKTTTNTRYVTSSPKTIEGKEGETLEERVERILQMSRNIK